MLGTIRQRVRWRGLTYLGKEKLGSMLQCLSEVRQNNVPGNFLEFGIALGGSAIIVASELDEGRCFFGLDVFGLIPPPKEEDGEGAISRYKLIKAGKSAGIRGGKYYGYVANLKDVVIANFKLFNLAVDGQRIRLVEGLYEDTLPTLPDMQVAFAHLDCDLYDSVHLCLAYVAPRLAPGGFIIILDDYNDWPGCKKAADEFLAVHPELTVVRYEPHAILTKSR